MPTTVTIHFFKDGPEPVPAMCMYCGAPLKPRDFEEFTLRVGHHVRSISLPICFRDRSMAMVKHPDGHSETLDRVADTNPLDVPMAGSLLVFTVALGVIVTAKIARNLQRHQGSLQTTFTFDGVKRRFADELDRLRDLSDEDYDVLMAKANEEFLANLHANAKPKTAEELAAIAQREAEDSATFGMKAAGQSEMSVEVTRSNSRKMLVVWGLVGVLSLGLLTCIAGSVAGLIYWSQRPQAAELAKKQLAPPKEMKAKIKNIDRDQRTIRLLVGDGKYQTFRVTDATEIRDENGQRLAQGLDAQQLRADEFVSILTTDDRQGLQWVRLTK